MVIVSGVVCTVRVVLPATVPSVAEMVVLPGIDGGGEAGAINSGHTRARGRPRDLAGQVLRAAIGISPGGGE